MKRIIILLLFVLPLGCDSGSTLDPADMAASADNSGGRKSDALIEARRGFQTKLLRREKANEPLETPPAGVLRIVSYNSPAGNLAAYLTPAPTDEQKHPAIIWINGGDCNTIGDFWSYSPPENDQSARAFREAGIVTMYPSLRGGNTNPGVREGFLGEVDDVLAAADYLAAKKYVDAHRIYLGGHSTGGTLVMLAAEMTPHFRAVFSFGPVANVQGYPNEFTPFDRSDPREIKLRSPGYWMQAIDSPVFVLEGTKQSNIDSLQIMKRFSTNPQIHFHPIPGADHFSGLAPATQLIAAKILQDNGEQCNISFSENEMQRLVGH